MVPHPETCLRHDPPTRLTAVPELLARLSSLAPLAPRPCAPEAAIGAVLAGSLVSAGPVPAMAVALRAGHAVASLDLVGASMHSPIVLTSAPPMVAEGAAMPPGCDAMIDPSALQRAGPVIDIIETPAPGSHARFAGHDLAAGAVIAQAGAVVTPEIALAARLAGHDALLVRRATVLLDQSDAPIAAWLAARLAAIGCAVLSAGQPASGEADVDFHIVATRQPGPVLALSPGDSAWLSIEAGKPVIELPRRFDGAFAAWAALGVPVLAQLTGLSPPTEALPLAGKLSSAVGATEIALLACRGGRWHGLGVGDITLGALAEADAFLVMPPGSEGIAAGEIVAATMIDAAWARAA